MKDADFAGWGSRSNVKCTDGRTILSHAFKHQDKAKVPLVWQHQHNSVDNVLGHAFLEDRPLGTYVYGFFNKTPQGVNAKEALQHGDIDSLSIFANRLRSSGAEVMHGNIIEVSLVYSGANPEAFIEHVNMAHSADGVEEEEAIIYTGIEVELDPEDTGEDMPNKDTLAHADSETTIADVWNGMSEEQRLVSQYVVGLMNEDEDDNLEHTDNANGATLGGPITLDEDTLAHMDSLIGDKITEGFTNMHNLFEQARSRAADKGETLEHSQLATIFGDASKMGNLKDSFLAHADEYGITNIDFLFPDAKTIEASPSFIKRRTEWVETFLAGVTRRPFSRIKSIVADITEPEARARGYVKGNLKKEEVIKLLKRSTEATTIYKKQKLDRQDIISITSLDIVAWLKAEMRVMLDEEIARACLVGDGREPDDDDKVDEEKIRPIAWDADMYNTTIEVQSTTTPSEIVETILRARKHYKGSGNPTLFTTDDIITDLMLDKDRNDRRYYATEAELAAALRVSKIVAVEVMEETPELLGVMVNLADYSIGTDAGGQLSFFDDFNIDYNQYIYLMEVHMSGTLTRPKSAVTIKQTVGTRVSPVRPAYDPATKKITIPSTVGVDYKIDGVKKTGDVTITESTTVDAFPQTGYSFPHNITTSYDYVVAG